MILAVALTATGITGLAHSSFGKSDASQPAIARGVSAMPLMAAALAGTTIIVNTADDVFPANGSDGKCTLREAITAANSNAASGVAAGECAAGSATDSDTIIFTVTGEITLVSALPDIVSSMSINGSGAQQLVIKRSTQLGTPDFRIFTIVSGQIVSFNGFTISNGSARGADGFNGVFAQGGGIFNSGTLTITSCIIIGNLVTGGNGINNGAAGQGGGIYNDPSGIIDIINSAISDNQSRGGTGGSTSGLAYGGGFYNFGTMTLMGSTVTGNSAAGGPGLGSTTGSSLGGGIFNNKELTITNSVISNNSATGATNGGGSDGGGILNFQTLIITNSTVTGNRATGGPGAVNSQGGNTAGGGISSARTLTITNSTISGNSATGGDGFGGNGFTGGGSGQGGGIYYSNGGTLTLTNSTISGNSATGGKGTGNNSGGGFGVGGGINSGQNGNIILTNSTISQNSATGGTGSGADSGPGRGGGIFSLGTTTLRNSTVTLNNADGSANPINAGGGGGIDNFGGTVDAGNTIIAGNTAVPKGPDVFGTFTSQGHNLIGKNDDSNFAVGNPNASQDIVGIGTAPVDPRLGPLANNGGLTQTHALLVGSPAIEAGDNTLIPADTLDLDADANTTEPVPFDQRGAGFPRTADSADADAIQTVDIGAFEVHASIENIPDKSTNEDTQLSFAFNVGDGAGGISVTATSGNPTLVPNDAAHIRVDAGPTVSQRTLVINPATNLSGTSLITVTVTFGTESVNDTFLLTVNAVNDAPYLDAINNLNINEDTVGQVVNLTNIQAGGAESQALTVTATSDNPGLIPNPTVTYASPNADGSLSITPVANLNGSAVITVTVTDDGGTANGGVNTFSRSFTVTVAAVNDAPVNTVPAAQTTIRNTALVFSAANSNPVSVSDIDAAAGLLQVTLSATNGMLSLSGINGLSFTTGDGTADATMTFNGTLASINSALDGLVFIPTTDYTGAASVQITTNDQGNTGSGGALSDSDTINITVLERMIQFDSSSFTVGETMGHATITVSRVGGTSQTASVDYATSDPSGLTNCDVNTGNASARCDYTDVAGTVNFPAGVASVTFDVPIINDVHVEGPETLTLTLTNPQGGILGTPSVATLTINDNDLAPGAPNPIDDREFFIRMHYMDFLGREPEQSGLQDWLNILNNCPAGDRSCDLIEVSSSFFRSPEFFDRAYYIYRFYDVALGRKPTYEEYRRDLRVVAGFLTPAELEARKQQFAYEFSQRADFRARYDRYPSATHYQEYVDALAQTAGITLPNRQQLAFELANSIKQRWDVLRAIVQSPEASQKFFNEAFVVVGYFSYLRREPDAQYLVWLNKLNTTGDYRVMVNGFIASQEYRHRFGPQ